MIALVVALVVAIVILVFFADWVLYSAAVPRERAGSAGTESQPPTSLLARMMPSAIFGITNDGLNLVVNLLLLSWSSIWLALV